MILREIEKPPLAETNPKQFADILKKRLEIITKKSKFFNNKDTSDIEAERMIDEHVNRVFKSPNEESSLNDLNSPSDKKNSSLKKYSNLTCIPTYSGTSTSNIISFKKNYDSGISIESTNSIERVNDWLANTSISSNKPTLFPKFSIPVVYFLPGEETAYMSVFYGKDMTLAEFKRLIIKKGNFRYFFKTKTDLLDEDCNIVYKEITDDFFLVPFYNNKIIAKIEKSNE